MIVLDASALIEMILDRPAAPWVLDQLEGAAIAALAYQPAEVLAALGRIVRAEAIEVITAYDAIADAATLQQELHVPTRAQLARALGLNGRVRMLDALDVVPAQDLDAVLVTADARLARADLPVEVAHPGR